RGGRDGSQPNYRTEGRPTMSRLISRGSAVCWAALVVFSSLAAAEQPLTAVHVFPADVQLTTQRDRQSLVIQAEYADGITRDVTTEATWTLADESIARLDGPTLYPVADGATELSIAYGGHTLKVPVTVTRAAEDPPIS